MTPGSWGNFRVDLTDTYPAGVPTQAREKTPNRILCFTKTKRLLWLKYTVDLQFKSIDLKPRVSFFPPH
jgi:hypothetical protein